MNQRAPIGQLLIEYAAEVEQQMILCAPFAKSAVVERILDAVDPEAEIALYTRWRPEEIAAGVSDTATLSLVQERGGSVFLCDSLHAKLFRFDRRAVIGSANLTAKALGWSLDPNLELLVEVASTLPAVAALEKRLEAISVLATEQIAAEVERVAALLPKHARGMVTGSEQEPNAPAPWHPGLREPRDLYLAYARGLDVLSQASATAAERDLANLEIPPGLEREPFERLVGARLLQEPLIERLDSLLDRSRRFGEMRDALEDTLRLDREEASRAWQTAMRWMLYFLPQRYDRSVPSHSEILVRKEPLP